MIRENAHVEISGSDRHFARYAADLPRAVHQPTQVGKASIGKAPVGKASIGKATACKGLTRQIQSQRPFIAA